MADVSYFCEYCGREIHPCIADINRGKGRYCSMSCYRDYKSENNLTSYSRESLDKYFMENSIYE